jgi:hypothetical protein
LEEVATDCRQKVAKCISRAVKRFVPSCVLVIKCDIPVFPKIPKIKKIRLQEKFRKNYFFVGQNA